MERPVIYGAIIMTRSGVPLWQTWLSKPPGDKVSAKQLCGSIAGVHQEGDTEDSSYLDAGTFIVASAAEVDCIVSLPCSQGSPETEVLLKAREVSHSVRLLFGLQIKMLSALNPTELAKQTAGHNLHHFLLESLATRGPASALHNAGGDFDAALAAQWVSENGNSDTLRAHFEGKLRTPQVPASCGLSPCSTAFATLRGVRGFVCAHFVDLKEPGKVLLSESHKSSSEEDSGKGSIQDLMTRHTGMTWTMVMREAKNLAKAQINRGGNAHGRNSFPDMPPDAGGSPYANRRTSITPPGSAGQGPGTCTISLSAFQPGLVAAVRLLQLPVQYKAALVVVYVDDQEAASQASTPVSTPVKKAPEGGVSKLSLTDGVGDENRPASATSRFRVLKGEENVPIQLRTELLAAAQQTEACFPATLPQLLRSIWPDIILSQAQVQQQQEQEQKKEQRRKSLQLQQQQHALERQQAELRAQALQQGQHVNPELLVQQMQAQQEQQAQRAAQQQKDMEQRQRIQAQLDNQKRVREEQQRVKQQQQHKNSVEQQAERKEQAKLQQQLQQQQIGQQSQSQQQLHSQQPGLQTQQQTQHQQLVSSSVPPQRSKVGMRMGVDPSMFLDGSDEDADDGGKLSDGKQQETVQAQNAQTDVRAQSTPTNVRAQSMPMDGPQQLGHQSFEFQDVAGQYNQQQQQQRELELAQQQQQREIELQAQQQQQQRGLELQAQQQRKAQQQQQQQQQRQQALELQAEQQRERQAQQRQQQEALELQAKQQEKDAQQQQLQQQQQQQQQQKQEREAKRKQQLLLLSQQEEQRKNELVARWHQQQQQKQQAAEEAKRAQLQKQTQLPQQQTQLPQQQKQQQTQQPQTRKQVQKEEARHQQQQQPQTQKQVQAEEAKHQQQQQQQQESEREALYQQKQLQDEVAQWQQQLRLLQEKETVMQQQHQQQQAQQAQQALAQKQEAGRRQAELLVQEQAEQNAQQALLREQEARMQQQAQEKKQLAEQKARWQQRQLQEQQEEDARRQQLLLKQQAAELLLKQQAAEQAAKALEQPTHENNSGSAAPRSSSAAFRRHRHLTAASAPIPSTTSTDPSLDLTQNSTQNTTHAHVSTQPTNEPVTPDRNFSKTGGVFYGRIPHPPLSSPLRPPSPNATRRLSLGPPSPSPPHLQQAHRRATLGPSPTASRFFDTPQSNGSSLYAAAYMNSLSPSTPTSSILLGLHTGQNTGPHRGTQSAGVRQALFPTSDAPHTHGTNIHSSLLSSPTTNLQPHVDQHTHSQSHQQNQLHRQHKLSHSPPHYHPNSLTAPSIAPPIIPPYNINSNPSAYNNSTNPPIILPYNNHNNHPFVPPPLPPFPFLQQQQPQLAPHHLAHNPIAATSSAMYSQIPQPNSATYNPIAAPHMAHTLSSFPTPPFLASTTPNALPVGGGEDLIWRYAQGRWWCAPSLDGGAWRPQQPQYDNSRLGQQAAASYYRGSNGETYAEMNGQWFLVDATVAGSAVPGQLALV